MKIIHTSDWHLGHLLYEYDRTEEHRHFLSQLAGIVREEQPDALVVSGDVFHYSNPSAASQRLFTDALLAIHNACPWMQIVVTAGNHDSSSKLEVASNLWKYAGVSVIGQIERKDGKINLDRHIVEIKGSGGELKGYVAAVPHVFPQNFPALGGDLPRLERQQAFFQTLLDEVAGRNSSGVPVVMTAHLAVTGSDVTGHDEGRGGMEYTDIAVLGTGYDYLALGHIHCPQTLKGGRARYSGSPVAVSFDEDYVHSISIVELDSHGSIPAIRTVPLATEWPLKVIPDKAVPIEEALEQLEAVPDEEKAYIELFVRIADVPPAYCMERANRIVSGKKCRFCRYKWERVSAEQEERLHIIDADKLLTLSPQEVASVYYQDKYGQDMGEDLRVMLDTAVRRVKEAGD